MTDKGKRRLLQSMVGELPYVEEIGVKYYLTEERRGFKILEINGEAFVESDYEVYYGGVKIRALDDRVNILMEYVGVSFSISRNDVERERFEWVGGSWKLKNGVILLRWVFLHRVKMRLFWSRSWWRNELFSDLVI